MKKLAFCVLAIALFATSDWAQTISKTSARKTALAYFQSEEGGNHAGTIRLKLRGKIIELSWWDTTRFKNFWDNPNAKKRGAELRIVYDDCRNDETCPKLVSVTFTGRVRK